MIFSSLFARKSEQTSLRSSNSESGVFGKMMDVVKRVGLALGCTVANVNATPQAVSQAPQPIIKKDFAFDPIQKLDFTKPILTQPLEIPVVSEKKGVEPLSFTPELPRATAIKGQSVAAFMMKNFHKIEGWQFLVDYVSGHRVRNSYRDLIAGRTYILATNETEARSLSIMLKQKAKEERLANKRLKQEAKQASKQVVSQVAPTEKPKIIKLMPPTIPPPNKDNWGRESENITKVTPLVTQKPAPAAAEKKLEKAKPARAEVLKTSPDKKAVSSHDMDLPRQKKVSPLHMRIVPLHTREQALQVFEAAKSNIATFFRAIGTYESGNNRLARNPSGALGIYQILKDDLPSLGFTTEQISKFLDEVTIQDEAMRRYTNRSIRMVLGEDAVIDLLCYGVHPFEILSVAHHGGYGTAISVARKAVKFANPVAAFHQRLKSINDKSKLHQKGVTTANYIKAIMEGCGLECSAHSYRLAATGTESSQPAYTRVSASPVSTSSSRSSDVDSQVSTGKVIEFTPKTKTGGISTPKTQNISRFVPQVEDPNESTNVVPFQPSKRNVAIENQLKAVVDVERKVVAHVADALHREEYGDILSTSLVHHSKLVQEGNRESLQTVQKLLTLREIEERNKIANLFGDDDVQSVMQDLGETNVIPFQTLSSLKDRKRKVDLFGEDSEGEASVAELLEAV